MKSSNLAQRVEEYEADIASMQPARSPRPQLTVARDATAAPCKPARRTRRVGGIVVRGGDLKPFRVR
jgi:hypothetical protein